MRFILSIILVLVLFIACTSQNHISNETSLEQPFEREMYRNPTIYKVDSVVDGDTFWVINKDSTRIKIRLIGIDAPEIKTVFNKKRHPFGTHSKTYVDSILTLNPFIKITCDIDSLDRYGRTLAYVYLNDGTFLNEKIIREGYATLMTVSPNITHQDLFYDAQVYARENRLGIWKDSIQ